MEVRMGFLQYLFGNRFGGGKHGNSHGNNNENKYGSYNKGGGHHGGGSNKHGGGNRDYANVPRGQEELNSPNNNEINQSQNYAKYCTFCGAGQKSDALFCSQCGERQV